MTAFPLFVLVRRCLLNRYAALLGALVAVTFLLQREGGLGALHPAWRTEIPLLLYLYFALNRLTRPSRRQPLVAALPIFALYAAFEIHYRMFGRVLRATEVLELPELAGILPPGRLAAVAALVLLPPALVAASIDWRRGRNFLALLPLALLLAAVEFAPDPFLSAFRAVGKEVVLWSDCISVENNGRLSMMLYQEAQRRSFYGKTSRWREADASRGRLGKLAGRISAAPGRNVHLVVLESFLDPALFASANYSRPPVDPDFEALFRGRESLSVSPVFGGGTAQAEFEILCGVPAFQELSGIEFNVFTGARTYCLPALLEDLGYRTWATNAFKPNYFNAVPAYRGIGFGRIFFPREYAPQAETYLSAGGNLEAEWYLFDGDLLAQNLAFVEREMKKDGRPLFNYVVGMYGHFPHLLDEAVRPSVIRVEAPFADPQFERAVNQHYYRTRALARYVRRLLEIDPRSLILLVSDHLPPLEAGPHSYRRLGYPEGGGDAPHLNRLYVIENGRAVKFDTLRHYEIARIVLNYVSGGRYCRENACGPARSEVPVDRSLYHDDYMAIMALATQGMEGEREEGEPN